MNIQMQTVGVFSAPLVVIAKINFFKVVTKFWVILLTMLEINVGFFSVTIKMKSAPQF